MPNRDFANAAQLRGVAVDVPLGDGKVATFVQADGRVEWKPVASGPAANAIAFSPVAAAAITGLGGALYQNTVGTRFLLNQAGTCQGVTFRWPAGHSTTVKACLWDLSGGAALASGTVSVDATEKDYTVLFGAPVALAGLTGYVVSVYDTLNVFEPTANAAANGSGLPWSDSGGVGTPVTAGNITLAPYFYVGGDAFPGGAFSTGTAFNAVEPVFTIP